MKDSFIHLKNDIRYGNSVSQMLTSTTWSEWAISGSDLGLKCTVNVSIIQLLGISVMNSAKQKPPYFHIIIYQLIEPNEKLVAF